MAIQGHDTHTEEKQASSVAQTEKQAQETQVVAGPYRMPAAPWWRGITSPLGILFISILVMVAILFFSIGSSMINGNSSSTTASRSSSSSSTSGSTTSAVPVNVPNATQSYGGQDATYKVASDGAKLFTFTAEQVMWEPVAGKRVLADTINGTVPGPTIHVTAGDHLRITVINHLTQSTSIHWHGLMLPSSVDGVPGVGQSAIQPGKTYVYDFTIRDEDAGTHWYHSHDNDLAQVTSGLYGAFIIDPRPGSPEVKTAIHADVEYTDIISELDGYYVISGKSYPDTQPIKLKQGQTVHIRLIGASEMMHPMHLHGDYFNIVAEDGRPLAQPIQKDTVQIAPGETYDLVFYGWAAPGSIYPFHCHILSHLMNPGDGDNQMGGLVQLVEYAKA